MYILFLFEIFICRITCCILLENYNKIFSFILISGTFFLFICFGQFTKPIRDRQFNLKGGGYGFLFRSEFFLSRKVRIFFLEFNIRLYDKNSQSDYFFFPPPKSEYFFRKKPYPPPPPFRLNGRSLTYFLLKIFIWCTYLSVKILWC